VFVFDLFQAKKKQKDGDDEKNNSFFFFFALYIKTSKQPSFLCVRVSVSTFFLLWS
jgi:hypothetical protein